MRNLVFALALLSIFLVGLSAEIAHAEDDLTFLTNIWPPRHRVPHPPGVPVLIVLPIGGGPPLCVITPAPKDDDSVCVVPQSTSNLRGKRRRGGPVKTVLSAPPDVPQRTRKQR